MSQHNQGEPGGVPAPPFVYVPVSIDDRGQPVDIRMVKLGDGRVALVGYTALDRFVDCCGTDQPWAVLATDRLPDLHAEKPFDVKLLDVPLPVDLREQMRSAR